ncbi:MAG: hypothetical protein A3G05_00955 [Candidatus Zambryskibacteria bacterium RIFCSPLOWO2_12_FULL_45_14]|uniref:Uncharacterized protein n=2 Tax=Candidatus Zambryskiibacteriota TaxID=1817925 RepID=A0A1G2UMU3_9BACT|nr:MAG: hypothetical protein A3H60_00880 [Candidatus Zambryskibacteria bacterium RIFCSPLOWO2_02_FULL_44_12b]OHB13634.1 MAG: hypothetical protein A3G05_00955 [Candidatus Zambryskibacteria bacterium RIFCSPLOWO2_12_FULL_45_14]
MNDILAQSFNLIVCDGVTVPCTFAKLIELLRNLITALVYISTLLAAMAFAYAGFKLLTSGGSESSRKEATDIFVKVLKGYLWILFAWLIVYTISSTLLNPQFRSILSNP